MERVARVLVKVDDDVTPNDEGGDVWNDIKPHIFPAQKPYEFIGLEFIEWEPEEDDGN